MSAKGFKFKLSGPMKMVAMPNLNKANENEPDFRGVMTDEIGDEFYISLWKQKGEKVTYLRGNVTRKEDLYKKVETNK